VNQLASQNKIQYWSQKTKL